MVKDSNYKRAVETLKCLLSIWEADKKDNILKDIKNINDIDEKKREQEEVYSEYENLFQDINNLSVEDFISFLSFENNKHWTALYRSQGELTSDMTSLKRVLKVCLDETKPIQERLDSFWKEGRPKGFGKATMSAFMIVATKGRYAVWNGPSEKALEYLGVLPNGSSFGDKYSQRNNLLKRLSKDVSVDLWILDWLLWIIVKMPSERRQKIINSRDGNIRPQRSPSKYQSVEDQLRKRDGEVVAEQNHNRLQNKLYNKLLESNEGDVTMEENYIDVKVENERQITLYEIKSERPIHCIRQGIGQLLSYLFIHFEDDPRKKKIVIVGPNAPEQEEKAFIDFIKKNLCINFEYQQCS